jgi:hypothetical protein
VKIQLFHEHVWLLAPQYSCTIFKYISANAVLSWQLPNHHNRWIRLFGLGKYQNWINVPRMSQLRDKNVTKRQLWIRSGIYSFWISKLRKYTISDCTNESLIVSSVGPLHIPEKYKWRWHIFLVKK